MGTPHIKYTGKGTSYFSFIGKYCVEESQGRRINRAFHRLCSLMRKMGAETVVIEKLETDHPIINRECTALCTYYKKNIRFKSYRFTFVSKKISTLDEINQIEDNLFLSSAILINYKRPKTEGWRSFLYNAIVAIPKMSQDAPCGGIPLLNNYIHVKKIFKCKIDLSPEQIKEFQIEGAYFCQQNTRTSVCAHASIVMIINNMKSSTGELISAEDINTKLGIDHDKNRIGRDAPDRKGLSKDEIEKVLKEFGLRIQVMDFFQNPNYAYNEFVYRYVESRCPVLLVFLTHEPHEAHVVSVLGHTLNSDMWKSEAESAYSKEIVFSKSAAAWVDHFIIHDDNFGMYLCLPTEAFKRVTLPKYDPRFRVKYAIAIIPSGVTTRSSEAEMANEYLIRALLGQLDSMGTDLDQWSRLLLNSERPAVIRTFLCDRKTYKDSLNREDFKGNKFSESDKNELLKNLPLRFWLSEISLPDLYTANRTKIIDAFYGARYAPVKQLSEKIFKRWIQIRLPNELFRKDGTQASLSVGSHYPLINFGDQGNLLVW